MVCLPRCDRAVGAMAFAAGFVGTLALVTALAAWSLRALVPH